MKKPKKTFRKPRNILVPKTTEQAPEVLDKGGRPTKYTPEREAAIMEALSLGLSKITACKAAHISDETLRNWELVIPGFLEKMGSAEYQAIRRNISLVQAAASRSWQAATWFLERKLPKEFGTKTETKLTGAGGDGAVLIQYVPIELGPDGKPKPNDTADTGH